MLKKNPFAKTKRGDVLAIKIGQNEWGFIRYRDTAGFGVLPFFAGSAGMPDVRWHDDIEKWFRFDGSSPGHYDPDRYAKVGNAPFDSDEACMPPRYQDPDPVFNKYSIIYSRPMRVVYVDGPADIKGIQKSEPMLPPAEIAEFIRDKYEQGLLTRVSVVSTMNAEADSPGSSAAESTQGQHVAEGWPEMVFAKIIQSIGSLERERLYEGPLREFLSEHDLGELTGGGTMQDEDGTILFAGIDIEVRNVRRAIPMIAKKLAELGAPAGSELEYEVNGQPAIHPIRKPETKRGSKGNRGA